CDVNRIERPSGDQSTCHPSPARDRSSTFEPSACAMYITWSPVRFELKAIRDPSGDHDGYSPPSVCGRTRRPVPSGLITESPSGPAEAITDPAGDQAGDR